MTQVQIYTADQAAELMACSVKTVEDLARRGELPGLKPGGGWIFPAGALAQRLDELAIEQAAKRREPEVAKAIVIQGGAAKVSARQRRLPRVLPTLVDVTGAMR